MMSVTSLASSSRSAIGALPKSIALGLRNMLITSKFSFHVHCLMNRMCRGAYQGRGALNQNLGTPAGMGLARSALLNFFD